MDTIYTEMNEEKDFTEGINKRRISSILKAPRTPLCDLGTGNEFTQEYNVEKRQKNSRRVSFAETIRVFPHDPQTLVELNHAVVEPSNETRNQNLLNENEEPEATKYEITGMNTLLHAPIHTLQQMECLDANPSQELNITNRTLIFSEQNEMDMTSGHTILITHDTKVCQETDKPKKINFESFLSQIKPGKKASQVTETCFSYSSVQMNESNLSQQKTNTEKTDKINLGDFLESLRSTKLFSAPFNEIIPSGGPASERSTYSSKQNVCSHLQTENCNMTTVFGGLDNRQHDETSALSIEKAISASKQLGCAESMDLITANTERLLPSGTSTSSMINQQQNLGKDKSVTHSTVSCTLRTSNYQLGIQQNTNMSHSEINANNKETNINHNSAVKITNRDTLPSQTSFGTITGPSVTSVPVLHGDKTNFSEDMEMTKNCTGLIWEVTDSPADGLVQKQKTDIFELMDRTNFREIEMDITKNHVSMNSYLNSMHHSNLVSKMTAADQQNDHGNMELLNQRVNLSSARNINLNTSQVSKNFKKPVEIPLVPYTTIGITKWTNSATGDSTINRTIGLSNNAVSLIPEHENTFASSENMEISKAVGSLRCNSLKPVPFQDIPQQLTGASRKSITDSDSDKFMALPLSEDNEMEITKSCTVPVNYNMLQHDRTTEVFPLESVDKTTNVYNDMDETKPITCIISQYVENSGSQIMQKPNRSGRTRPTKDRTIVFSLNDGNEMDITRSHTVALNHDAVTFAEDRPVLSTVSSNKTILLTLHDDVEITNPVASETLRSISDFLNVPKQSAATGRKTIESDSDTSVAFPLSANSKLEFRKNLTEAVERAPQEQTSPFEENVNINISNNMAVNKSMSFAPSDKTVMFVHNNDMEITKPISMTSIKDTGFETLQSKNKENGKAILVKSAKKGTDLCLLDENEMEMTRSHTVAVNYDIQHAKVAPQKLFSDSANETSLSVHNNYETNKSSSFVPAENTMIMSNHDMEMTKSLPAEIFKNSLKPFRQKTNLNCESTLVDPVNISVFAQQHNEMEITKCHTVLVNHDDVFHKEKILQISVQNNMDTAGFPTIAKNPEENFHKNKTEPEKNAEWEFPSNQTANEPVKTNMHTVLFDNKTIEYCQNIANQTKQLFPFNEKNAFTYQDGTEATSLHSDTISCGNLQEVKKERLEKNMEQNHEEKANDLEFIKKHTVTNKEHNCYVLSAEKQIPNTSRMSKEKTVAFSDDGHMEVTSNYTTGIERMFMSDRNECELHSLAVSNVKFSASIIDCEKKLNIDKIASEKSIVQVQQNILNTKERLEPCRAKINHMKENVSIVDSKKENELIFPIRKSSLVPTLSDEIALGLNREKNLLDENKMEKHDLKKLSQSRQLDDTAIKAMDVLPYGDKIGKKPEWGSFSKDQHNDLKSSPINILPVEEPVILNKESSVISNCPMLQDAEKKPELVLFSCDAESTLSEELPKLIMKPDCSLKLKEDRRIESNAMASKAGINSSSTEGIPLNVPLNTDNSKIRIMPLAIFPPKLPNKRKPALSNIDAPAAKLDKNSEIQDSQVSLLTKSSSDKITQKLCPFYIDEELLPSCAEEMDSNESLCHEVPEKCPDEIYEKMIVNNEMFETNQKLKRSINQENENIQGGKKLKKDMDWNDTAEQKQILHSTEVPHNNIETDENKHIPEVVATKREKKQSSKNNLFDSFKVDTSCNNQQNIELETQLLMDSICEQNLQERLLEGTITVREFFTLLQVHVLIQMPRQSHLPVKPTVNTSSIPEDEILSHCIYHPKLQVYKEDCQTLHTIIEELKLHAADQDKPLANMNKSFWEVMKTCSKEELSGFGAELNKMKSRFTKKSKVLAHKGKAKLYVKLVHHAKLQCEKLQSRLAKMDELLKEMDSCLFALEKETATLDDSKLVANYATEEHETKVKHIERELENYKSQEDNLQRDQSDLSDKKQQITSEINQLQRDVRSCQELTEKYNFSEWVIKEWNDHQAVFTFLYDSIELTVGFKWPLDDATFQNKFYWEIVSLNFETLLDETKAAPTAKLVHKLIFQFIDSQNSWQKKCSTVYQLSQILHDLSLVVNRCQLLGEEIEFLNKWGGKFYLLKTEVNDTNVSLLFSSSTPLAKFEVELSLSANYPTSPIVFTIQKCTGNLGHAEISVVLSSVPVGANYLKRMVNQISCNLLQYPAAIPKNKRAIVQ
ncbi:kinetochore scaffold 1 [Pantherophis guttatus]|uniref:Kinetochore scaffold 1 n=1 Tax=Pantherophis guttatus TaxID=94885 RepID=A0A6P9C230_PANGU|nr:kinetochore scaffold 1 [Pantherophis guttatus]XP_034273742.1 kinetochore scaffold 1 [Pantherophis guttatus]XP_060543454.1 kinetochore scaffold 1 [Pantherophis guttatus]